MRFRTIARTTLAAALAAALMVPAAAIGVPPVTALAPTAALNDGNNVLPGVSIGNTTAASGNVSVSDPWDIYQMPLSAGEQLYLSFTGKGKGQAYAFLLAPGAKVVDPSQAVAMGVFEGKGSVYPQVIRFSAKQAGTYSLVVFGSDSYTATWSKNPGTADDDAPGVARTDYTTGDLSTTSDWSDVYAVPLTTGQVLSAELVKPADHDFQLQLFGPDASTVYFTRAKGESVPWPLNALATNETSGTTTQQLTFEAPRDGTYYLQAAAFSGEGNYQLTSRVLEPTSLGDVVWATPTPMVPESTVTASGHLLDPAAQPIPGATVFVQRWDAPTNRWLSTGVSGTTAADGGFSLVSVLDRNQQLRVRYGGAFGEQASTASTATQFAVPAQLGKPYAPSNAVIGRLFTVTGTISPRHAAGSRPLTIRFQRRLNGVWVTQRTTKPVVFNDGVGSRYRFRVALLGAGTWRVKAYHAGDHAPSSSDSDFLRVRP